MTRAEYLARLAAQQGVCAACREPETRKGRTGKSKRLVVDRSHTTGAVRGLICSRCDALFEWAKDDPAMIRAMAEYVARTRPSTHAVEGA